MYNLVHITSGQVHPLALAYSALHYLMPFMFLKGSLRVI